MPNCMRHRSAIPRTCDSMWRALRGGLIGGIRQAANVRAYAVEAPAKADKLSDVLSEILQQARVAGTYKHELVLETPQSASVGLESLDKEVLNFCANNYLGLSNHPKLVEAAHRHLDSHGFGLSSVRFICGTQDVHKQLEQKISEFHGTEDTILYPSCFDANAAIFESILTAEDAIISDKLNHASIIDGIRLCKAERHRYEHMDMADLEEKLKQTSGKRLRLIATDGVFSMDGDIAPLDEIVRLATRHDALVFVDDCHATGILGATGRGTDEHCGVAGRVDVINSTLGKALGGATGGYTTGRADVVSVLRQKARPYLFSNTLAPAMAGGAAATFDLLGASPNLVKTLQANTSFFRDAMVQAGFEISGKSHPIVPIMLGDARLAGEFAEKLLARGVFVVAFSYPVVPKGQARIRVQLSAAHTPAQLRSAVDAFVAVGKELGVVT